MSLSPASPGSHGPGRICPVSCVTALLEDLWSAPIMHFPTPKKGGGHKSVPVFCHPPFFFICSTNAYRLLFLYPSYANTRARLKHTQTHCVKWWIIRLVSVNHVTSLAGIRRQPQPEVCYQEGSSSTVTDTGNAQRVYLDIIKRQKGSINKETQWVAELKYTVLVMSYLNSEFILLGITQKRGSGQPWQKLYSSFCFIARRFSPLSGDTVGPGEIVWATACICEK